MVVCQVKGVTADLHHKLAVGNEAGTQVVSSLLDGGLGTISLSHLCVPLQTIGACHDIVPRQSGIADELRQFERVQ